MFLLWDAAEAKPLANFNPVQCGSLKSNEQCLTSPVLRAASSAGKYPGMFNFAPLYFSLNLTNCEKAASLLLSQFKWGDYTQ